VQPLPKGGQTCQLSLSPDKRCAFAHPAPVSPDRVNCHDLVSGDGFGLALERERPDRVALDLGRHEAMRLGGDQDPHGRGDGLEARRDVHRVADGEVLLATFAAHRSDDDVAGVDPDADVQADLPVPDRPAAQLAGGIDQVESRPDRAHRVVLVGDRRPEEREESIAQELRNAASVPLDDRREPGQRRIDHGLPVLGVEALGDGGRAHDVEEEDRDRAPFVARLGLDRPTARRAEPRVRREPRSTRRATPQRLRARIAGSTMSIRHRGVPSSCRWREYRFAWTYRRGRVVPARPLASPVP
jgi:hypothetical protein